MRPLYVYILYSATANRYYVGTTQHLDTRLEEHNRGKSNYTRAGIPWVMVWNQQFEDRASAMRAERWIKQQKSRVLIDKLINGSAIIPIL